MSSKINRFWIYIIFITLFLTGIYLELRNRVKNKNTISYVKGHANYCKTNPKFIKKMKIPEPVYIDMTQEHGKGLVMISGSKDGRHFQLPSWNIAGCLGPYTLDEEGNIYVAPIPFISVDEYPPEEQSVIYKLDSQTGELNKFMIIPWVSPPHEHNPFNILALTYDCDTRSLYVSSVSGSSYQKEIGRIYQINVSSKEVVDQIDNLDAIGLGIFNFNNRKELYIGLSRLPEIHKIKLDQYGHFIKYPQLEFSLQEFSHGTNHNCNAINFIRSDKMELKAFNFNYSLHSGSSVQRSIYNFDFDLKLNNWKFVESHIE